MARKKTIKSFATVEEREELARALRGRLGPNGESEGRRAGYAAGAVAGAYLAERRIRVVADEDGFALQVEVGGAVLPWLHGVPDGATVRAVTQHGRTQWHVFDESGAGVGLIFHGEGSMWQWRFHDAQGHAAPA